MKIYKEGVRYIVYDLEATCDSASGFGNEIIEIGAVMLNEDFNIMDTFRRFVKPVENPVLTEYCKLLTNIKQEDVDKAKEFPEIMKEFTKWLGENYLLSSWGFYDIEQIVKDCERHGLDSLSKEKHISLKHQYSEILGTKKRYSLAKALKKEGFVFTGNQHRALTDAINTTKIFQKYNKDWKWENAKEEKSENAHN